MLARRAARAAQATTTEEAAHKPSVPAFTAAAAAALQQRKAAVSGSYFWKPSASSKAAVGASVKAAAVPLVGKWQGLQPVAVALQGNDSLVVAMASGELVLVDASSGAVVGNASYDPSLQLNGMAASRSAAYLLLIDDLYGEVHIDGMDVRSGQRISRATLSYPTLLGGVDPDGKQALTSAGGSRAVWLDTNTGARTQVLYNPAWTVSWLALNPANLDVWLVSSMTNDTGVVSTLYVLQAGSNSTRFSAQLTADILSLGSISVDPAGQFAYMLYVTVNNQSVEFIIEQFRCSDGQSVAKLLLPPSANPARFIAASSRSGMVYWINGGTLTLSSIDGSVSSIVQLGPPIANPSDVAVAPDGRVLVANNEPFRLTEFNSSGGLVESFPLVDEFADDCDVVPYVNVAVEPSGMVLMPICNSTILIFDRRAREVERLYTGNASVPRAVSAGPRGSILFSDDNHPRLLKQMARNGSVIATHTVPYSDSLLLTIHWDNRSQTAWVVDYQQRVVLQWPLDESTVPKVWNISAVYGQQLSLYSAVLDPVHQQLLVTAGSSDQSAAWVLWLDLQGRPLFNFSFPISPSLPFAIPTGVAVSPDGSRVYATDYVQSCVYVLDNTQQQQQPSVLQRLSRHRRSAATLASE